ncbi:MAG TPA: hypothetical protein VEB63_02615 [Chitinophagaceae bacterium]|nr:hypothetical protein [Chitinophagaceae bacterium]
MKNLLGVILLGFGFSAGAQQIDSIYFNLYTDSLKKGQHNYINVDGKFSDGRWLPLTGKELEFSSTGGKFSGNELIIPHDFTEEKVTVKAVLRSNPAVRIERTIWIKRIPDPATLPTEEEILNRQKRNKSRTREA